MAQLAKPTWLEKMMLHLIQEVPTELSVCEFDCHQSDCRCGDPTSCQRQKLKQLEAAEQSSARQWIQSNLQH